MILTAAECGEIYRQVRSILVRQWIDLGYLNIHVGSMSVNLSGRLQLLEHSGQPLEGNLIEHILGEIQDLHGVKQVLTDFDNWKQTKDFRWYCAEQAFAPDQTGASAPTPPAVESPETGP